MPEERIKELELQLLAANASIAALTTKNRELASDLADADMRNKKLKRSARQSETSFQDQLTIAKNRRT